MNIKGANVQIMWKEIAIILLVVYTMRLVTDIYIKTIYNKICTKFYSCAWNGLEEKIRKHRKVCDLFSNGPFNKKMRSMYNGLCMALSSMALIENNDAVFVTELNNVKKEEEYEMKSYALALYYRSKNDNVMATKYYHQ